MEKPKDNKKQIPEFKLEVFKKTLKFFENAIDELAENISEHKYDIVVGDDVSGRLPTLVLHGVMKKVYTSDGVDSPKLLFFKGNKGGWGVDIEEFKMWKENMQKELLRYLQEGIINKNSKILIVTEFVKNNNTILNFNEIFGKIGLGFEVLALQRDVNAPYFREGEIKVHDAGVVYDNPGFVPFCNPVDKKFTGIKKSKNSDALAGINKEANKLDIKTAREDIKKMIDYLENYYNLNK